MNFFAVNGDVIDGSGSETFYASGAWAMALALDGTGLLANRGTGSIDLDLSASGAGLLANRGNGEIQIGMDLSGIGSATLFGFGQLDLQIVVAGTSAEAIRAAGEIPIALSGLYDLPDVQVIPAVYAASPSNRSITVPENIRRIAVAADYELPVARQDRTLSIEQEGRRA